MAVVGLIGNEVEKSPTEKFFSTPLINHRKVQFYVGFFSQ